MLNNHRYYRRNGIITSSGYYVLNTGTVKRSIVFNQKK